MVKTEREHAADIVRVGRLVFEKGWVAANDGNISIRLDDERVMCTPTGVSKGMLHVDDIIIVDYDGEKVSGRMERTSEIKMHLKIYELREDIDSVVHAHPPVATGFAAAGRALNTALLPEVIIGLGCVPLAGYGLPGTEALTDPMLPYIPPARQPRRRRLRQGRLAGLLPHGDGGALRAHQLRRRDAGRRPRSAARRSGQAVRVARTLRRRVQGDPAAGLPRRGRGRRRSAGGRPHGRQWYFRDPGRIDPVGRRSDPGQRRLIVHG